jgi:hypothetical protein
MGERSRSIESEEPKNNDEIVESKEEIIEYDSGRSRTVDDTVEGMIKLAEKTGKVVRGKHNGVSFTTENCSTVEDVLENWKESNDASLEEYYLSPEGKKNAREEKEQREKEQQKYDALVEQLPNLDFANYAAVLDWFCEIQGPSDRTGVVKDPEDIIIPFLEHGYHLHIDKKEGFMEDRDRYARNIVSNCLYGLRGRGGYVHPAIHSATNNWKKKFGDLINKF